MVLVRPMKELPYCPMGIWSSAGSGQGMLVHHSDSPSMSASVIWWVSVSSARQASMSSCTPVISSTWDSLKSVVMRGCVSGAPSARGCGRMDRLPSAVARRLSFSRPRAIPRSVAGSMADRRVRSESVIRYR